MAHSKSYDGSVSTIGCIKYKKCAVKKGQYLDGLLEIYKDFFRNDNNKKWIFRAETRNKPKNEKSDASDSPCENCSFDKNKFSSCREKKNRVFRPHLDKAFSEFEIVDSERRREAAEQKLIRSFKRRAYHYMTNVPEDKDVLEWLALIRHYGGPTRLLDFTYSFFVACYFAINKLDCDEKTADIWAIDAQWLSYEDFKVEKPRIERIKKIIGGQEYLRLKRTAALRSRTKHVDCETTLGNEIVHFLMKAKKPRPCAYNVTPFRLNDRLNSQQGTFLLQGDLNTCFLYNLKQTINVAPNSEDHIFRIKLELAADAKIKILNELGQMGIGRAVLFPDLQGYAESLREKLAFLRFRG